MGSLVGSREGTPCRDSPEPGPSRTALPGGLAPLDEHAAVTVGLERDSGDTVGSGSASGGRTSLSDDPVPAEGAAAPAPAPPLDDSSADLVQDNSEVAPPAEVGGVPGAPRGEGPRTPGADAASGSGSGGGCGGEVAYEFQALTDLQCQKELELEVARSEPAPPVPPAMQHVMVSGGRRAGAGPLAGPGT
jgi:hypothetical protein